MKQTKFTARKRIMASASMLVVSSVMLSSATYAWFTMNKVVSVDGMQVMAHAEEGLLINEVPTANSATWDELATGGDAAATALRPASTSALSTWWHANSLKSSNEAGYGTNGVDDVNTVEISDDVFYTDISGISTNVTTAAAGTNAEKTVYYNDATYGATPSGYDDGEGYYILYKYYLKSSGTDALNVATGNLKVDVTATKMDASATSDALDASLRVGVKIGNDVLIFAPVSGATTSYNVTNNEAGSAYTAVTARTAETAINTAALTIPAVTANGLEVDVYVWFEGEDPACKSDNLTAALGNYEISIKFTDAGL